MKRFRIEFEIGGNPGFCEKTLGELRRSLRLSGPLKGEIYLEKENALV